MTARLHTLALTASMRAMAVLYVGFALWLAFSPAINFVLLAVVAWLLLRYAGCA